MSCFYRRKRKVGIKTIPPMTPTEYRLYELPVSELRTICNYRKGKSCRDKHGKYLSKAKLIELIMMEVDVPKLPPRNKKNPKERLFNGYMVPRPLRPDQRQQQ